MKQAKSEKSASSLKGQKTSGNMGSLPLVLPDLRSQLEEYLTNPELLSIHDPIKACKFWPRVPDVKSLYAINPLPSKTTLVIERDCTTGAIIGVRESETGQFSSNAANSFSLNRIPGPPEESVKGSAKNFPFWPGGIDEPLPVIKDIDEGELFNRKNFLTKHPLLSEGINFEVDENQSEVIEQVGAWNIADMLTIDFDVFKNIEQRESVEEQSSNVPLEADKLKIPTLTPKQIKNNIIEISKGSLYGKFPEHGSEWAKVVDVNSPVNDFEEKIPDPACKYPFTLDTFQKQAILHIENQDFVFVAAHTSAGKTVVAEYAIAVCLKHMTRAIYTSPIKALSNQKYRDLKQRFGDVGLLTGDIQINTKASCLIMTTEILQSMLYGGSDLIRDLEWVIFDEVHYINNADRGHVWEEVIIMLPSHVNIVLLSATVPNTVEFADWIGRIKKRKIYVISTLKRPVPLEHFLYTGTGGRSRDERFLLVNAEGALVKKGYMDALLAKKSREKKNQQGPKYGHVHNLGEKQESNMWIGLLDHLKKNDLLPVVSFTLSRKRCDLNATLLLSQDLTSSREKNEISIFIRKCIDRLKDTDKSLPQVVHMKELLSKGIGVHHSGILPLLKEVVEMLFAKGLVKLLFATETFAMGVNMPARSVVFDAIRKHDGKHFRNLLPSEYIQMAGRAGRRGIDTTGAVIILCKVDVPEMADLHKMMLGRPTKLESQFKLTYSMILNLLRVESLRVEDMMKRSFSEAVQLINQSKYSIELEKCEAEYDKYPDLECLICTNISDFYSIARDYVDLRNSVHSAVFTKQHGIKLLQPGRIIVISYRNYQNTIACIAKTDQRQNDKFTVFVMKSDCSEGLSDDEIVMETCLSAASLGIKLVEETTHHQLLEISCQNIVKITKKIVKVDFDRVIDNVKMREIPRFKDAEPGKSVRELLIEFQRINETLTEDLSFIDIGKDLGINKIDLVQSILNLQTQHTKLHNQTALECPQFAEHFRKAFDKLKLKEKIARLKYLMSEESLQLHPEYQNRIDVLKTLNYIENDRTVTLKGRVACEMHTHELMITELFLEYFFCDREVDEICALLSCLVFQDRNKDSSGIPDQLNEGVKRFKDIAKKIGTVQKDCGLPEPVGDFVDQFNFGLAEVVYHWAQGKPFKEIMDLTEVQEGITVKCIQRLDETFRDVKDAARIIGDPDMYALMESASTAIKRDIVFAASLYTQ